MDSTLTFIHALSPLHAGTGQGVGVIDLPIAREKATNLPYLPGSTLKGTLRDGLMDDNLRNMIFGPEKVENDSAYSGSVIFTDQKLLCLPVRSLVGTFAWVTSPFILERFKRDCAEAPPVPDTLAQDEHESCVVTTEKAIQHADEVILEDLDIKVKAENDDWAEHLAPLIFPDNFKWQKYFRERFCIVSDNVLNFLAETCTEVIARNVLSDETKTAENLWYEESLPAETILSGLLIQVKGNGECIEALRQITQNAIQLGGSMTVGRGLCRMIIDSGGDN